MHVQLNAILTLEPNINKCSVSRRDSFIPRQGALGINRIGRWVGPGASKDASAKEDKWCTTTIY
jgi:hypothetical protein